MVFSLAEVAGAAERNRAGMTKKFPLIERGFYSKRGIRADDGVEGSKFTVDEIKGYCDKLGDFGHRDPLLHGRRNLTLKPAPSR